MTNDREQILTDPIAAVLLSDLAVDIRAEFEDGAQQGSTCPPPQAT